MGLISSFSDLVGSGIIFVLGLIFACGLARKFSCRVRRAVVLYVWHSIFCVVYAYYVFTYGGDSVAYFELSKSSDLEFSVGTAAIRYFTHFFTGVLGLSFLPTFFVFNIFGFVGLLAFDASLRLEVANSSRFYKRLANIIIFLPSASFWSSAIGKDSISFMATGLSLWAALAPKRRFSMMAFAVVIMFMVRPHMAGVMVLALAAAAIFQRDAAPINRIFTAVLSTVAAAVVIPFGLGYAGVEEGAGVDGLEEYVENRQGYNTQGGGGVDLTTMPLPLKLFSYIFRPLPFEAFSIPSFAASIDNLLLLFMFLIGCRQLFSLTSVGRGENRLFLWIYSMISWVMLSLTTANMGIAVRQKWMFVPMVVFILLSIAVRSKEVKKKSRSLSFRRR